jgi:hypothetical protein
VEALHVGEEAAEHGADLGIGVADWKRSSRSAA